MELKKNENRFKYFHQGGSPGLVVMGGDSRSECHEFESQH